MKKFKLVALALVLLMTMPLVTACTTGSVEKANENKPLVIQVSELDGVFNPFFYSSAYDGEVLGLIYNSMLITNPKGELVCGDEYATIAKKLDTAVNTATNEVTYTFTLKKGLKFSDGSSITADDVLFNYYVYLDPAYVGSTTMYTLPIKGLKEYRFQDPSIKTTLETVDKITSSGSYVAGQGYTQDQYDLFYNEIDTVGVKMIQDIYDYVIAGYYNNEANLTKNTGLTKAQADAKGAGFKWAYAMKMWGFGSFSEDFVTFTDALDQTVNTDTIDKAYYWSVLKECYTKADGTINPEIDAENAGSNLPYEAAQAACINAVKGNPAPVTTISGLSKGTTTIAGEQYETVVIVATEPSPKTILQLGATIVPKAYYTTGYAYQLGRIQNFGCELGYANNKADDKFMNFLKTKNASPVGSGPYKMGKGPGNEFFEDDSIVYFVRNENFESFGLGNAKIKNVRMKVITSGAEYDAVKSGDVHFANPSASSDVMADIAKNSNLTAITVDNLGYGYICVNPKFYPNVNERIALNTVFDLSKVYDYYQNGLADVIYRSMSQVSWAYPTNAQAKYAFDQTGAKALQYFQAAGYTVSNGKLLKPDGTQLKVTMKLPSDAASHPAGKIFLAAKDILTSIGATAEIEVDAKLIQNIKGENGIEIYALAWQAALDPDMYQTTHYASQADSVIANGIKWLYDNGTSDTKGTITFKGVEYTQTAALKKLGDLIEEALIYMQPADRKPVYADALELLALLSIEIPTYQRKNLFVFDNKVIDATSLSEKVTPYWGAMAEIWEVSFTKAYAKKK